MTDRPLDRIRAERERAYAEPPEPEITDPLEALAIEQGARPDRVGDVVKMLRDRASLMNDDGTPREVAREVLKDLVDAHAPLFRVPRSPGSADGGTRQDAPPPDAIREAQERGDTRAAISLKRQAAWPNAFPTGGDAA